MNSMFVFYIDDDFFKDGLTVKTIQEFQVLLEVPLQLDILTFYNKSTFLNAMKNIGEDKGRPKFKDKIKDVFGRFKVVEDLIYDEKKINIKLSKISDKGDNKFSNAHEAWTFIISNLPKRNFNPEYSKHGRRKNDGTLIPAQKGESQLLTKDNESQDLLDSAIFDLRKRASFHVNFDGSANKKYILFPDENTNENTFHAFHLEEKLWNEKIPNSIRKYFNK